MNSENKSLLVISVGPKTALSRSPGFPPANRRAGPPPSKSSLCGLASSVRRASSEQQRSKVGFPIRKFPDQSLFAAPRNLSQRTTSFIASQRQGIHQIPLRHLIALIAKARFRKDGERTIKRTREPASSDVCRPIVHFRTPSALKRPVLLQTHPGI